MMRQAVMISGAYPNGGFPLPYSRPSLVLRHRDWQAALPVLLTLLHVVMGAAMGIAFGLLTGAFLFWTALGTVLGLILDHAAMRTGPPEAAPCPGLHRVPNL